MDIIVSKWIGLQGTAILAKKYRGRLLERYPAWLVDKAEKFDGYLSAETETAIAEKAGACAIHHVSEGGIYAALWEMAERAGAGLRVELKKIPIRQETVEICNYCDVNPYELLSGGCLLIISSDGEAIVNEFEASGIPAVVIGRLTEGRDRLIINEDKVSFLNKPRVRERSNR